MVQNCTIFILGRCIFFQKSKPKTQNPNNLPKASMWIQKHRNPKWFDQKCQLRFATMLKKRMFNSKYKTSYNVPLLPQLTVFYFHTVILQRTNACMKHIVLIVNLIYQDSTVYHVNRSTNSIKLVNIVPSIGLVHSKNKAPNKAIKQ